MMPSYVSIDVNAYHINEMADQLCQIYVNGGECWELLKEHETNDILICKGSDCYRFTNKEIRTREALILFDIPVDRLRMDMNFPDINLEEILASRVIDMPLCQIEILPVIVG